MSEEHKKHVSDREIREFLRTHRPRHFGHLVAVPKRIARAILRRALDGTP